MEHGLVMLEGTMVYRLGESWYTIQAGDVVYMAPYCPQWAAYDGRTRRSISSTRTGIVIRCAAVSVDGARLSLRSRNSR